MSQTLDPFADLAEELEELTSDATGEPPVDLDHIPDESDRELTRVTVRPASSIKPARVKWVWQDRIAQGSLAIFAGREGLGKSTVTAWLTARVTRGELPGEYFGTPRSVAVVATEDSWASTIVPRLIAANADLDRVFKVEAHTVDGYVVPLSVPRDLGGLETLAVEHDIGLVVLDPLTSRLHDSIDTHKDADTRRALEPLAAAADRAGFAILGLAHWNKSPTTDPLTAVMGSRAFAAVARSVHTVLRDPDDDTRRLFGTPKNNLGRDDLPLMSFTVVGHEIASDDGPIQTSRADWGETVTESVRDVMQRNVDIGDRTATDEAAEWLADYLYSEGGRCESAAIKRAGAAAGHSQDSLKRARRKLGYTTESVGFPRRTYWLDPQSGQSVQPVPPSAPTAPTAPTGADSPRGELFSTSTTTTALTDPQSVQSAQSVQLGETGNAAPTGSST